MAVERSAEWQERRDPGLPDGIRQGVMILTAYPVGTESRPGARIPLDTKTFPALLLDHRLDRVQGPFHIALHPRSAHPAKGPPI
jgi:hypothetical protein